MEVLTKCMGVTAGLMTDLLIIPVLLIVPVWQNVQFGPDLGAISGNTDRFVKLMTDL